MREKLTCEPLYNILVQCELEYPKNSTKIIMTRFISNVLELSATNVMFNQKIVQHNQTLAVINTAKKASGTTSLTKKQRKEDQSVVTD